MGNTSLFKRTRDSIKVTQAAAIIKEKAGDKINALGGKLWGFLGTASGAVQGFAAGGTSKWTQWEESKSEQRVIENEFEIRKDTLEVPAKK